MMPLGNELKRSCFVRANLNPRSLHAIKMLSCRLREFADVALSGLSVGFTFDAVLVAR
jgi:hypothetical protein